MTPTAIIDITKRFNWRRVLRLLAITRKRTKYEKIFTRACPSCFGIAPHRLVWKLVENNVASRVDIPKATMATNDHE